MMSSPDKALLNGSSTKPSDLLDDGAVWEHLPVGAYVCDAKGLITRYNAAAAELWGRAPRLGEHSERFCGSYRLLDLNDNHIPHAECPMAIALATGQRFRDQRIQVERPDGSRIIAVVDIEPLKDDNGRLMGAVNVFRDSYPDRPSRRNTTTRATSPDNILLALPVAIYTTDAEGKITFYNEAAVRLWGIRPEIGRSEFCGSWKLYWPDGTPLPADQCPMAVALKERKAITGHEAAAQRPDGTRAPFLAYATPLFSDAGELTGAVNLLVDISGRKAAELATQRLAAIVASSDDAILSKDVNGIIMSWNQGAERVFGYRQDEVIGKPVTILIPQDRQDEEPHILARIRQGERIEHYETIRQRKDGSLVDISLSVSPIFNTDGKVIGASKIARDISHKRRAEEQKDLLLREMNHRVKNLFALAGGLVNLSARGAASTHDLVSDLQGRFMALARAHSFTVATAETDSNQIATLHALIAEVTEPYCGDKIADPKIAVTGDDFSLGRSAVTNIALLLHEFATNALKYGALGQPGGHVVVECTEEGDCFRLVWREAGASRPAKVESTREGFGSRLARATIGALNGSFSRDFTEHGMVIHVSMPREKLKE